MTNEQFLAKRVIELEQENKDLRATVRLLVDADRARSMVEQVSVLFTREGQEAR